MSRKTEQASSTQKAQQKPFTPPHPAGPQRSIVKTAAMGKTNMNGAAGVLDEFPLTSMDEELANVLMELRATEPEDTGPGHVEVQLSRADASVLRTLHRILVRRHASLENGRFVDPNSKPTAVRWLISRIARCGPPPQSSGASEPSEQSGESERRQTEIPTQAT